MQRTWQDNAEEFAALSRQGKDLRLAVLVACSVEERHTPGRHPKDTLKASAREFAMLANTGHHRITRHLEAWNRLADDGHVNHARFLRPEHVNGMRLTDEATAAFSAMVIGVPRAAVQEASRPLSRPTVTLAYDASNPLEAARLTLAPIIRQASFAVAAIGKLSPRERMVIADDLARLKTIFTMLADGHQVRPELLEANG